jgi:tRNA dimethylallyltransferase
MSKKHLICIVGPTAIGKTFLSIQLANAFNTEILSADSRQFFREMNIGTAAPTPIELNSVPHHFIHHISIEDEYSVGDFERDALAKTEEIFKKNDNLILVGGSGLYIKSFLKGLDNFPEINPEIRKDLNEQLDQYGLETLKRQLKLVDIDYYNQIDIENPHRVIRALEVSLGTGKPFSFYLNQPKEPRNFETVKLGLNAPREIIYERINLRVDIMMEDGLLGEAKVLYPHRNLNALNTVGYKELFDFLDGKWDLPTAVEEIKKNTRHFAKRQLTWFRKQKDIQWFDYTTPLEEIVVYINSQIKQ